MNTVTAIKNSTAIAIGGFDGMHIGHQRLFEELGDNGTIVVIETGYANLTPKNVRENFSNCPIVYFDLEDIRHLDAKGFLLLLKEKFPKLQKIVVGFDFHFGKDRAYSFEDLRILFDGEVIVVDEVCYKGDSVHSHKIRVKLTIGDIKSANDFLGHNYTIAGNKILGQGIGKKELVATINIKNTTFLLPKEGVYATLTRVDDEEHYYPSVSFIGNRATTDGSFSIETHILDSEISCKEKASISFISFIRDNQKFNSLKELKKAIISDIDIASKRLKQLQL